MLKCLFIITMCQWYLCTIKLLSFNYVLVFSVMLFNLNPATWRPVLSKRNVQTSHILAVGRKTYLSVVHISGCMSVMTKHEELCCMHMREYMQRQRRRDRKPDRHYEVMSESR